MEFEREEIIQILVSGVSEKDKAELEKYLEDNNWSWLKINREKLT